MNPPLRSRYRHWRWCPTPTCAFKRWKAAYRAKVFGLGVFGGLVGGVTMQIARAVS